MNTQNGDTDIDRSPLQESPETKNCMTRIHLQLSSNHATARKDLR